MKCGLCQTQQNLLCSSCSNHELLPLRISLLETLQKHETAKNLIDIILKDYCIHGANYEFISRVIKGEIKWEFLNEKISKDSIMALASQLLTIDSKLIAKDIIKLEKIKQSLILNLRNLELQKSNQSLEKFPQSFDIEPIKEIDNNNNNQQILKQIKQSQNLLVHELIQLYTIKRKKLLNSSTIIMISFTPVISISQILDLNKDVINFSFQIMCKFLKQISSILNLELPYQITYNSLFLPEILKFQLYLPFEINKVHELSNFQLKLLINGFARLTINFYKVLQKLNLQILTYSQLFQIDEWIYKLAHPDYVITSSSSSSSSSNDKILIVNGIPKIDVDILTLKLYRFILGKINQKNNEWHVVN